MGKRKEFTGIVTSDKMQKTIVVKVMRMSKHPKYGKILKKYKKYKAHDEKGLAKIADRVVIVETRPLSKDKRFILKEVLKKAQKTKIELDDTVLLDSFKKESKKADTNKETPETTKDKK